MVVVGGIIIVAEVEKDSMFRNLLYTIRKFKVAASLNIIGLIIAFTAFIIIMMQVDYEMNFNSSITDNERIFRVEMMSDNQCYAVMSRPGAEVFWKSSHVQSVGYYMALASTLVVKSVDSEEERFFTETMLPVSPGLLETLSFEMIEGNYNALENDNTIIIPESMARKFYPDYANDALGKIIVDDKKNSYNITGVYRDFPKNTSIDNYLYTKLEDSNAENWRDQSYSTYIKLDNPSSTQGLLNSLAQYFDSQYSDYETKEEFQNNIDKVFAIRPLRDVYFANEVLYANGEKGSKQTTYLLICIAFVILIIASINFANFCVALTPLRIKSINTQKVIGASTSHMRFKLLAESATISFCAFLLSLVLVYICRGSFIDRLVSPNLVIGDFIPLILITGGISIIAGIIVGLYPSFYMTSLAPALVLKGSFGLSPQGRKLRSVLMYFQYIASISLFVIALFMFIQNRYLLKQSYGYDRDCVLRFKVSNSIMRDRNAFRSALLQNESFKEVGFTFLGISSDNNFPQWGANVNGDSFHFHCILCTPGLPEALGLKASEGRLFNYTDTLKENNVYIMNESAKKAHNLEVGQDFNGGTIVGFVPDFQYSSFRAPVGTMGFAVANWKDFMDITYMLDIAYVQVQKGFPVDVACGQVMKVLKEFDPYYPFVVAPIDDAIKTGYKKERNISSLVSLFSIMAIIISVIGIFSLVVFDTEYSKKEIGIRKVFGSTSMEILRKHSLVYIKMILICSIVSVPISLYIVTKWFERFTSHSPIYWWVFAIAFIVIASITLATITWQNLQAARSNPVDCLKSE